MAAGSSGASTSVAKDCQFRTRWVVGVGGGPDYRFKMEINLFQGPTSEPYCLAMTRTIWPRCPRSCVAHVASSCLSVTWPSSG